MRAIRKQSPLPCGVKYSHLGSYFFIHYGISCRIWKSGACTNYGSRWFSVWWRHFSIEHAVGKQTNPVSNYLFFHELVFFIVNCCFHHSATDWIEYFAVIKNCLLNYFISLELRSLFLDFLFLSESDCITRSEEIRRRIAATPFSISLFECAVSPLYWNRALIKNDRKRILACAHDLRIMT